MSHVDVQRVGFWSAVLVISSTGVFGVTIAFAMPLTLSFAAALVLAPAFVAMMVSIHGQAPPDKRLWSHLGVAFAAIYAAQVTMVYYVQLSAIRLKGAAGAMEPWVYKPGTPMFALDMLAYAFMCLSTWVAAPVFTGRDRLSAWTRGLYILHGTLVIPTLIVPLFLVQEQGESNAGAYALLGWCAIFIPLAWLTAVHFRRRSESGNP